MTLAVIKTVLKTMTMICLTVVATTEGASAVAVITTGFSDFECKTEMTITISHISVAAVKTGMSECACNNTWNVWH